MATLKYKTPEGEWKKVSIGGGGSTEEVYVGSDAPTDENVKVWIDPQGTPSSPSVDNGIRYYVLPEEAMASLFNDGTYIFTGSQAEEVRRLLYDWENYTYIIVLRFNGSHFNSPSSTYSSNAYVVLAPEALLDKEASERLLTVYIPAGRDAEGMFSSDSFNIWEEDGVFLAGM